MPSANISQHTFIVMRKTLAHEQYFSTVAPEQQKLERCRGILTCAMPTYIAGLQQIK